MTKPRNLILGFLVRFVVIYTLLIIPWPGWNEAYDSYFQALGKVVFAAEDGDRILQFNPDHDPAHPLGTRIVIGNRTQTDGKGGVKVKRLELDTRSIGWVPTALICALVLATPVPWKRRLWALAWGVVWIHLIILFSLECWMWDVSSSLSLANLSPIFQQIADGLVYTLITQLGASFSVPVLIWIFVTFRRQDAVALFQAHRAG